MRDGLVHLLRVLVSALEGPVVVLLLVFLAGALFELGLVLGERTGGLSRLLESGDARAVEDLARARIGRADILARVGPMLGLMGTLIPLGPGLASLGQGDVRTLAASVTLAFDTTVLGLSIGALGYGVGQTRRRHFGRLLDELEKPR